MSNKVDITIIGGGIVGLATGLALTKRTKPPSILIIEAEEKIASHQTGHNSGVIHSGLYYKPGSLKAKNCVEGAKKLYRFCEEQGISFDRCGKIVVAVESMQIPALDELERRGRANGLEGIERLNRAQIKEKEPHACGIAGLFVPSTGIVDFKEVAKAIARLIEQAGGKIETSTRFLKLKSSQNKLVLETNKGEIFSQYLINCAGLQCDRVARLCGINPQLKIIPFRGEYYKLSHDREHLVNNLIYPVPDPCFPFLGVHFTRMIGGGIEAGPNAVLAFKREGYSRFNFSFRDMGEILLYSGFWKMASHYWKTGCGEMMRSFSKKAFAKALQKLLPEIEKKDIIPAGSGVRAQAINPDGSLVDDFRLIQTSNMTHVLNAPSPAATSSLSIGETIAEMVTL